MPTHSPPSGPKSLSFTERDSRVLFLIRRADRQTEPWIPREFFFKLPSETPRSK